MDSLKLNGFKAWKELVKFVWTIFSIGPLLRGLFIPFHRDEFGPTEKATLFERAVFNILLRLIGAVARLFIIFFGLVVLLLTLLLIPLFVFFHLPIDTKKLYKHRAFGRDMSFRWTPRLKRAAREISRGREIPLIGKEDAMTRLEHVLARDNQSNALIVGAPGVGRSTLVSQFAKRVAWGQTLPKLRYKHVFELSLENLDSAGVSQLFSEAARAGNVVVVVDNIHAYTHLFDAIVPFTEIAEMQIIAITDTDHFHSTLKSRADFLERFEKIELSEPSEEETALLVEAMLRSHKVKFEEDVPTEIVRLTTRLIMYVPQPEKSLDVVEELLATKPKLIKIEDVHALMSAKSGVPVGQISGVERDALLHLEETLTKAVIGQAEVIKEISEALRRGRTGVASGNRPIGSFLLLGPTGVGKSHTAKKLAQVYYGREDAMIRFDMTEFSQESSVEEFAGRLVVAIEENPFTLVLFDEIEKAHRKVLNLFLQILDEARITNSAGREAHFHNAFIICTSNAGSELIVSEQNISKDSFINKLIERGTFVPEFLNRFDGVFMYRPLDTEAAEKITELMLTDFVAKMKQEKDLNVVYDKSLVGSLARMAQGSIFGAREIRRILERTVLNYLADVIIKGEAAPGGTVTLPINLLDAETAKAS